MVQRDSLVINREHLPLHGVVDTRVGAGYSRVMRKATIRYNRSELASFCLRWKIAEVALFGSVLRDDFGPDSDVDVLVTFGPDARWGLFEMVKMQEELRVIFGRDVDLLSRRGIESSRNPLRRKAILESAEVIHVA